MANKKGMQWYDWLATVLVLAGAVNWGLVGFFDYNAVEQLLGSVAKYVYDAVGVAAVYSIIRLSTK